MEEVLPPKPEKGSDEDRLVALLREFLFDKDMRPRKGRKEFLLDLFSENEIPKEEVFTRVSDQVREIIKPIYNVPQHLRKGYLETLIRNTTIGMSNVPKGPFHKNLIPYLSMVALETYAKASPEARKSIDQYYQSLLTQHPLSDVQRKILNAIHHKDIKKLKLALQDPNFKLSDLKAVGIFDPLLYAHLNDFQQGLNAIYSVCKNKYGPDSARSRPDHLLALSIRTHQNENSWPNNVDYYEFNSSVNYHNVNKTRLLEIACEANNREFVNFLCSQYGFMEAAIEADDFEKVKYLVEHGAEPDDYPIEHLYANRPSFKPYNYIHLAIQQGKTDIAKYLIDQSPIDHICDDPDIFALTAQAKSLEILKHLFEKTKGKKIYFISSENITGQSPLTHACRNENVEMAEYLLHRAPKADVDDPNIVGITPLFAAYSAGNTDLAHKLIKKHANPLRLLGPTTFKFSLRGKPEDDVDHVNRIQRNVPENVREDLLKEMLKQYLKDHPTREIAQRLLNSLNGTEPSITAGDKFRLVFAPTLGKIYKLAKPFIPEKKPESVEQMQDLADRDYDDDVGGREREVEPLLFSDEDLRKSRAASIQQVLKQTRVDKKSQNENENDNAAPNVAESPRTLRAKYGLEVKVDDKGKGEAHDKKHAPITPRKT